MSGAGGLGCQHDAGKVIDVAAFFNSSQTLAKLSQDDLEAIVTGISSGMTDPPFSASFLKTRIQAMVKKSEELFDKTLQDKAHTF